MRITYEHDFEVVSNVHCRKWCITSAWGLHFFYWAPHWLLTDWCLFVYSPFNMSCMKYFLIWCKNKVLWPFWYFATFIKSASSVCYIVPRWKCFLYLHQSVGVSGNSTIAGIWTMILWLKNGFLFIPLLCCSRLQHESGYFLKATVTSCTVTLWTVLESLLTADFRLFVSRILTAVIHGGVRGKKKRKKKETPTCFHLICLGETNYCDTVTSRGDLLTHHHEDVRVSLQKGYLINKIVTELIIQFDCHMAMPITIMLYCSLSNTNIPSQ